MTPVASTTRRAGVAMTATAALVLGAAAPGLAATLVDWNATGIQFINADCARNEYVVSTTVTGTTDDGGGFDKYRVEVWDDGLLKDSRVTEVPVGATADRTVFLSFVGLYGLGAPGVGIYVKDVDSAESEVSTLDFADPFHPDDQDGPCSFGVERIGGVDRIETAALLAQRFIAADTVVVATSTAFPDSLAAAPLAAQEAGPLLLTRPTSLPAATAAEVTRLAPSTIIIVGGTAAVSQSVQDSLQALAPSATVQRLQGADRYGTSAAIAAEINQDGTLEAFLATGADFPDALTLSAMAARHKAPLVLTRGGSLPTATADLLGSISFDDLYVAGGDGVVSDVVAQQVAALGGADVTRFAGANRYETAQLILETFPAEGRVMVATGQSFPDALTAVPVASRTFAGIALTRPDSLPAGIAGEVSRLVGSSGSPQVTVVGGTAAVSQAVESQLLGLVPISGSTTPAPASSERNMP